jgi:purine-binding chemotaxis protein CheW
MQMTKTQESGDLQIVNFTVDNIHYGVPVEQVKEVRDMQSVTPVPGAPAYVEGVTNLRGQIITVVDLRKRLGLSQGSGVGEKILVIDLDKSALGVVVDSVTEVSTIKAADVERNMEVTSTLGDFILGVGKQSDRLSVILDISRIFRKAITEQSPN